MRSTLEAEGPFNTAGAFSMFNDAYVGSEESAVSFMGVEGGLTA